MTSPGDDEAMSSDRQTHLRGALARIADALGVSAADLMECGKTGTYGDEAAELMRSWFKIKNPAARRYIMEQTREAAAEDD